MSVQLKSIGEVFSKTWELYKSRAVPILVVIVLTTFIMLALISFFAIIAIFSLGGLQTLTGELQGGQFRPTVVASVRPPSWYAASQSLGNGGATERGCWNK